MSGLESPIIDKFSQEPPLACIASQVTWDCGSDGQDSFFYDRIFRYRIFQKHPDRLAKNLAEIYKNEYSRNGRFRANSLLREMDNKLTEFDYKLACNDMALRRRAESMASVCRRRTSTLTSSKQKLLTLGKLASSQGLELPNRSVEGIIARLLDPIWWRRILRKKHRRGLEEAQICLNMVNSRRGMYISNEGLSCHRQLKAKTRELLRSIRAINEADQEFTLEELANKSPSNPKVRRAELMMRIAGHEQYAKEKGRIAVFFTVTCPSRMHASHSRSGNRNDKYDGTTPRQAQDYLTLIWSRIRSKLDRENLDIHGIRVVEPHHDGTPHWHLLIFLERHELTRLNQIIRHYALQDSPDEPGAQKRRVTYELIDPNKGSAIGYLAKYISKNIDGFGMGQDGQGVSEADKAERVTAWASAHRVRQFQFFGDAPVSVWRELRRLTPELLPAGLLRDSCQASDQNDWCAYLKLMGGHTARRKDRPISLLKVYSDRPGRYGEPIGEVIKGVEHGGLSVISRIHTWRIDQKPIKYTLPEQRIDLLAKNDQEYGNLRPLEFCQ